MDKFEKQVLDPDSTLNEVARAILAVVIGAFLGLLLDKVISGSL